ncbi:basic proline-rich protein-like [Panthera uncia]|uniref:basic proline-rich protein-like n=1 Tax=Panthera uncia TaxID=29064 RepID=UPI0020FF91FF|nr:basic proline-rich protein-like [Panthera uncia]
MALWAPACPGGSALGSARPSRQPRLSPPERAPARPSTVHAQPPAKQPASRGPRCPWGRPGRAATARVGVDTGSWRPERITCAAPRSPARSEAPGAGTPGSPPTGPAPRGPAARRSPPAAALPPSGSARPAAAEAVRASPSPPAAGPPRRHWLPWGRGRNKLPPRRDEIVLERMRRAGSS